VSRHQQQCRTRPDQRAVHLPALPARHQALPDCNRHQRGNPAGGAGGGASVPGPVLPRLTGLGLPAHRQGAELRSVRVREYTHAGGSTISWPHSQGTSM
ncbi:MAG: hypothetical protein AVDCRST_MAG77-841, partial [uncultured Chloroflexi bacterium]